MKKSILFITFFLYCYIDIIACELCKSHQPKILQEVTHGTGPEGTIDYLILWTAAVIVFVTLILSIGLLVYPSKIERNNLIKFLPLKEIQGI